jgi:hypothetical protein
VKYQRSKVLLYSSVSKLRGRKISCLFKLSNKHQFIGYKKHNRPQFCHIYPRQHLLMGHRKSGHYYARYRVLGKLFRSARLLLIMLSRFQTRALIFACSFPSFTSPCVSLAMSFGNSG